MGVKVSKEDKQQKAINRRIESQIEKEQVETQNVIKLLLLGAGESGKSTILKQMRIVHDNGFTSEDYLQQRCVVYSNTTQSMGAILYAMRKLDIAYGNPAREHPTQKNLVCETNANCSPGEWIRGGHGRNTGRCVPYGDGRQGKMCEVRAWCPVENDEDNPKTMQFHGAGNATVFIKNFVYFEKYNVKRRNLIETVTRDFLSKCNYDPKSETNRFCPIFRLADMLKHQDSRSQ